MTAHRKDISKEQLIDLYEGLGSISGIAATLGCSNKAVTNAMKRYGVEYESSPRKYSVNHHFFDPVNETESQFYWAGWLCASANITKTSSGTRAYRIELNLGLQDKEHLQKLALALGSDAPIKIVNVSLRDTTYQQVRLLISSKYLVNDLARFGLLPNKKFTFFIPDWLLTHELIHHFLRGWVDGKGNFYLIEKNREFRTSGTFKFLEQVTLLFNENLPLSKPISVSDMGQGLGKIRCTNNNDVMIIHHYLYDDASVYLTRKRELLEIE
jgi:hypothetical protein